MVNENVTVELFKGSVKCDRYHLLYKSDSVNDSSYYMAYTESGNAFNGFFNPIILNTDYDTIKNSRIGRITIKGMNTHLVNGVLVEQPIYFLINSINSIRNNKTEITIEPDAWLNYRGQISIGYDNTLFKASKLIDTLPYYDFNGKYKYFHNMTPLENDFSRHVILLYHSSVSDTDYVMLIDAIAEPTFYLFLQKLWRVLKRWDIDTNEVISISISPFNISSTLESGLTDITTNLDREDGVLVYSETLEIFNNVCINNPTYKQVNIVCNPYEKTVITDMNTSIVWQAVHMNNGTKYLKYILNVSCNMVYWDCVIQDTNANNYIEKSPNNRFSIICNSISFFADYYQQYMNTEKSFNYQKRQAQLDKQLLDGIGDTIASTLWHGTSSGAPAKGATGIASVVPATSAIAMAGAAVGGVVQTGIEWYSTDNYYKRLNDIENRQAKVQYDKLIATSDSLLGFAVGYSYPSIGLLKVDQETVNSRYTFGQPLIDYNCRVSDIVVRDLILNETVPTNYVTGDFDFRGIPLTDAIQLNQRFKTGVNFTQWS